MNYKGIFYYLGIFSSLVSIFSFLNILYSIYFNSVINLNSYIFSLCISLLLSILFLLIGKNSNKNISPTDQLILILVTFIFIPILISIPYLLSNNDMNFIDSYFESISGFTTTGFSILQNINNVDEPLLLWRSS